MNFKSELNKYYEIADSIIYNSDVFIDETIANEKRYICITRDYQRTRFIITFYKDVLVDIKRDIY